LQNIADLLSTGYGLAFLDRQKLLQVLYKYIPSKTTIKASKRVSRIEHNATGVTVNCDDGSSFSGDIVGADGVHSMVRKEMQKYIKVNGPAGLAEKDENCQSKLRANVILSDRNRHFLRILCGIRYQQSQSWYSPWARKSYICERLLYYGDRQ
jgi:2-polyprenyl-6-methoxyphenol hydroxylase-like FAD-dependent oxidoreductase